ncbi:MAG TPA: tetratricopeptide repeat protein [Pirellulaceae bacterium]|nr:tetratricopeptide repeat protein [Pirellulaceae bacterium]
MLFRSFWFLTYHVILGLLALALQAGCSNFTKPSAALPWSKKAPTDELAKLDAQTNGAYTAALAKGMQHERVGQYDKAREVYEQMLKAHPDQAEPLHRLAVVADKQRRHPEAQMLYLEAIKVQPKNAELFNDLGWSFYLAGQLPKAESALAKAVQIESNNARYRNNFGMVLGQQGRMQPAFEQFAAAGSEADAHYNVAFLYATQNKPEEAKNCFQRALACDPTHEKAAKALDAFSRYEENGGLAVDDQYTTDGRRWIPYIENASGQPDLNAMTNFGINHAPDSVLPAGTHNIPTNREAGTATRSQNEGSRDSHSMASSR